MTDTLDAQPPRIEFPCEHYPIKAIDDAGEGFSSPVVEVIQRHTPDLDVETLVVHDSSKRRLLPVQVLIAATDVDQLQIIHNDLRATERMHIVF